jgi:hypothetical protein
MINCEYLNLTTAIAILPEQRGKKLKLWLQVLDAQGQKFWLFKVGRPNTLENITEVIASRLAELLGIPCAIYRLAKWQGVEGVASLLIGDERSRLNLGNEVLAAVLPDNYELDRIRRNQSHTLENVSKALEGALPPLSMQSSVPRPVRGVRSFYRIFAA